jgi:EAL domain-containing protein (putative c-di-GMP-specific phosphodiesterase class I)
VADHSTKWILWQRPEPEDGSGPRRPGGRQPGQPLWERGPEAEAEAPPRQEEEQQPPPRQPPPRQPPPRVPPVGGGVPVHRASRLPVRAALTGTPGEHDLIRRVVADRDVSVQFQPIRDAVRDQVVAFEALTRGPEGPLHRPDRLFAAARLAGLAGELDWVCRAEAFRLMLEAKLPPAVSLFVNVEPDSLIEPCPDDLLPVVWDATARLRVFIDVTGRALSQYPFEVLETVRRARAAGWGVAVGDVEFSATGVALLPTLEPDVVKVSHSVLTTAAGYAASAVAAVLSEVEQTGAMLLVERVEDEAGRRTSRSVGASLHSGRLFGYPEKLPARLPVPVAPVRLHEPAHTDPGAHLTPWKVLAERGAHVAAGVTLAETDNLLRIFAVEAAGATNPPAIGLVLPDADETSEQTRMSFQMLLGRCPLVLAVGHHVARLEDWRVRAAELPPGHPLLGELCVVALSPTQSMALAARRVPGTEITVDLAVSQQPAACREVMRLIIDTLDTLAGGVRHGR